MFSQSKDFLTRLASTFPLSEHHPHPSTLLLNRGFTLTSTQQPNNRLEIKFLLFFRYLQIQSHPSLVLVDLVVIAEGSNRISRSVVRSCALSSCICLCLTGHLPLCWYTLLNTVISTFNTQHGTFPILNKNNLSLSSFPTQHSSHSQLAAVIHQDSSNRPAFPRYIIPSPLPSASYFFFLHHTTTSTSLSSSRAL